MDLLVAPDVIDLAGPRVRITPVTGMPLLHITEPRIGGAGPWLKPVYERVLAVPLLVLASPLLVAAAVAIVVDSGRPIFYRQRRIGFGGREFEMLKFRTMVRGADTMLPDLRAANEVDGPLFKIRNDPRVTRVGRILRKFSLDELPQLCTVVQGEMVLVGAPSLSAPGDPGLRRGGSSAIPGPSRGHGPVAGERPLRRLLGRGRASRPVLRRELVAVLGPHHPVPDPGRRVRGTRRLLTPLGVELGQSCDALVQVRRGRVGCGGVPVGSASGGLRWARTPPMILVTNPQLRYLTPTRVSTARLAWSRLFKPRRTVETSPFEGPLECPMATVDRSANLGRTTYRPPCHVKSFGHTLSSKGHGTPPSSANGSQYRRWGTYSPLPHTVRVGVGESRGRGNPRQLTPGGLSEWDRMRIRRRG